MKQRGCAIPWKLKRAIIAVFDKKIKQIIFRLPDAAGKEKAKSWKLGLWVVSDSNARPTD